MKDLSPVDASILTLLAQVPPEEQEERAELLERLSENAKEIGEAVVADDLRSFSLDARETAEHFKQWAVALPHSHY